MKIIAGLVVINVQIIPLRMQQRLGVSLAFVNISVKETLRTLVRTTPPQVFAVSILHQM